MSNNSTTKRKKKLPPKKKRKPATKKPTRAPAAFFLLITAGLIGALYFIAGKHLPAKNPAAIHKTPTVTRTDSNHHQKQTRELNNKPQTPSATATPVTQSSELIIYRLSSDFSQLVRLPVTVNKNLTSKQKVQRIITLLTLPSQQNQAPLDRATRVRSVLFKPPLITIDLSADIRKNLINSGGNDEIMTIACLTNSLLKNFPHYHSLQILIEGKKCHTLAGHIDISRPLGYQKI